MKKLTVKIARAFALPFIAKIKDENQRAFILAHSTAVAQVSKLLAKNTSADLEILEIAGLVHDIGKSVCDEDHAEASLKILEREFIVSPILKDCILNHGFAKSPQTIEGRIIQAADKISLLDQSILPIFLKNTNFKVSSEHEVMLRKMANQSIDFLVKYNRWV
jgi:putative nucleotidyltransferase with HDIG domain